MAPQSALIHLFSCRSKKTSKLRVTGLCEGNSRVTGEFPAQKASNVENVFIWWRHHESCGVVKHDQFIELMLLVCKTSDPVACMGNLWQLGSIFVFTILVQTGVTAINIQKEWDRMFCSQAINHLSDEYFRFELNKTKMNEALFSKGKTWANSYIYSPCFQDSALLGQLP